jgi:hypothetical protein
MKNGVSRRCGSSLLSVNKQTMPRFQSQPPLSKRPTKRPRLSKHELVQTTYLSEQLPLVFHLVCHHGIRALSNPLNEWKWYGCYSTIFFSRHQNTMTQSIFRCSFFHIEFAHLKWLMLEQQCPEMANCLSAKGEPMLMSYVFMKSQ